MHASANTWFSSHDEKYMLNLKCFHGEYYLVVTDLQQAFFEELNAEEISNRGEHLEFALSNEDQISKFCNTLREKLASPVAKFDLPKRIKIEDTVFSPPLIWTFNLSKMSEYDTCKVFAGLCSDLLDVVEKMGEKMDSMKSIVVNKNLIIRGLDDAVQRKVEYRVPRHLEPDYKNRRVILKANKKSALELAYEFWPKEVHSSAKLAKIEPVASREETVAADFRLEAGSQDETQ